ncbi:hypothetical protein PUNSTDRAFT_128925 [Punctularia strigosozonata HHB-11173 SS5]|uniref:uncharacterized protein n=1 Tax=Punctularia strigosozonata (strain HHB-11173) TaxID=741275 RepID=UPI00044177D9|nr:uncharacterized protein PUNSTDRAFT_128925 [Punctularia strigosozonata HHB-11173 SS5]EIN13238.1 hypothetical protein PUNSTDRAFT_128925 [Punctularia strigosozonata HHB-11173 SS5]
MTRTAVRQLPVRARSCQVLLLLDPLMGARDFRNDLLGAITPPLADIDITERLFTSEDDLQAAIEDAADISDPQFSVSKSPIFPENALQLQFDGPAPTPSPSSFGGSSSRITPSRSPARSPFRPNADGDREEEGARRTVRFRSRVRIASGIPRERRGSYGADSAASDSPSSSISAPLRRASGGGEDDPRASYAKRLLAMTVAARQKRAAAAAAADVEEGGRRAAVGTPAPGRRRRTFDERDALRRGPRRRPYVCDVDEDDEVEEESDTEEARRKSEEEIVFGPWSRRIFDRHWWRWKIESVTCWCCNDDDDDG